jgi:hypothetical protein
VSSGRPPPLGKAEKTAKWASEELSGVLGTVLRGGLGIGGQVTHDRYGSRSHWTKWLFYPMDLVVTI